MPLTNNGHLKKQNNNKLLIIIIALVVRTLAGKYEGTVFGLDIGCFGELYAGFSDARTFITRNRAVSYVNRYDDKSPKEALGMSRPRLLHPRDSSLRLWKCPAHARGHGQPATKRTRTRTRTNTIPYGTEASAAG